MERRDRWIVVLLLALAAGVVLPNLGSGYLWQDEAQTALLGRTTLERGIPYGSDGRNEFSQELGAEYGPNKIWRWHPWLPFYLVAVSFAALGETTFAARLPFALLGIGCVALAYRLALGLWRDRFAAGASAILLLACVPFLLLSRQARYYAAAAFFSLAALEAYRALLAGRRRAGVAFVLALTALFHTHYVYCAPLVAAVALHALILRRERLVPLLLACGVAALLAGPWIVWLSGMNYADPYGDVLFDPARTLDALSAHASQLLAHVIPAAGLALAALTMGVATARGRLGNARLWSGIALLLAFAGLTVLILAATAPAPFFRYLAPVIPPLLILAGLGAGALRRLVHPLAGIAVVVGFLAMQPARDYVHELTHDYDGPIEAIVAFLDANAAPDDVVAISYGDLPLKFYTDLRIVGGLTGEDLTPAATARWVILRRHAISRKDHAVRQLLLRELPLARYRQIVLDAPDLPFENRESPDEHRYRSAVEGPGVVILERPSQPAS